MSYFKFEGHPVFYTREGAGNPIIFLPNATLDSKLWEHQIEHFRATNDAIAVDLPGFGRSDRVTPSLELWIRWLGRFIDELDLAPAALVGNCMGSLTELHYAVRQPKKVSALVLINMVEHETGTAGPMGSGAWMTKVNALRPVIEAAVRHSPRWLWQRFPYPSLQFGTIVDPCQAEYTEHAFQCFGDPQTRVNLLRLGYTDDSAVLPSPEQLVDRPPVCWVWGRANRLLPYEVGKKQLDVLKPDEVHVLEGRGYAVAWDDPDEINAIIEGFLDRYPRSCVGLREFACVAFP